MAIDCSSSSLLKEMGNGTWDCVSYPSYFHTIETIGAIVIVLGIIGAIILVYNLNSTKSNRRKNKKWTHKQN